MGAGAPRASVGDGEGESLPEAAATLSLREAGCFTVRDGAASVQVQAQIKSEIVTFQRFVPFLYLQDGFVKVVIRVGFLHIRWTILIARICY